MNEVNGSKQNPSMTMDCVQVYSYFYTIKQLYEKKLDAQLEFFMKREVEAIILNLKDRALLPFVSRGIEESVTKDIDKMVQAEASSN